MRFASIGSRDGYRPARSIDGAAGGSTAGFTLLETLTALTILAIALVALFDAHMRGLRAAGTADAYAEARLFGQALLTDTVSGWGAPLASRSGHEGRFNWAIAVAPSNAPWADFTSKSKWRLYDVRVTVAWDKDRSVVLDTLKLGRAHE
jgi:prepilin-type N-terminal cleavage/methylation domain-containing protein